MNQIHTDADEGPGLVESIVCWLGGCAAGVAFWTLIAIGLEAAF